MADENFAANRFRMGGGAGEGKGQGLILAIILSITTLVAVALILIWLNIERTMMAYKARNLQHEVEQARELNSKLGVEREHLLSPAQLGRKAEAMGLGPAKAGQVRRMDSRAGIVRSPETDNENGR